jgi:hypothetical protein
VLKVWPPVRLWQFVFSVRRPPCSGPPGTSLGGVENDHQRITPENPNRSGFFCSPYS